MENNISEYDLLNMLDSSQMDYYKEDLLNFIKCASCKKIMIEPLFCSKCQLYICSKCNVNCKNTKCQTPRHLKDYLDKIKFNCKSKEKGCQKSLSYSEIFAHFYNCEFNREENYNPEINLKKKINGSSNFVNLNFSQNETQNNYFNNNNKQSSLGVDFNKSIFFFDINQIDKNTKENDGNYNNSKNDIKTNIDEMIENRSFDLSKSTTNTIDILNTNNDLNYFNRGKYREDYEAFVADCFKCLKGKEQNNAEIIKKFFEEQVLEYDQRNKKIEILAQAEKELKKTLSQSNEKDLSSFDKHPEFLEIVEKKRELLRRKSNLELELMKKMNEINKFYSNDNSKCINSNSDLNNFPSLHESCSNADKKIEELNLMEHKLMKLIDESQPGLIPSYDPSNLKVCFKCKNDSAQVKKIICEECKIAFCENKCIKICAGEVCLKNKKYVCPKHNKECSLCLRHHYCNLCLKKCYYNNCNNFYCPTCYKRNEHQTRNSNISCKFFTCDRDNVNECIMSSLFCQSCEKRICKNCIQTEKDHFPYLK